MSGKAKKLITLLTILFLFAGIGYAVFYAKAGSPDVSVKNTTMDAGLPPIDLAAPQDVEIATFALG